MQSEIVCRDCRTLLRYPAGASQVRCVVCSSITNVHPPPQQQQLSSQHHRTPAQQHISSAPTTQTNHLICGGCRTMLAYPAGAQTVRCAVCMTVNQLVSRSATATVTCQGCNTHLMYTSGASSVRCALCQHVTPVGGMVSQQDQASSLLQPTHAPQSDASGSYDQDPMGNQAGDFQRQGSNSLYVIQNPSEEGEEVFNMAIGLKQVGSEPVYKKEEGQGED